jgi:hypothetical protein
MSSVPINDFAVANVDLAKVETELYYSCYAAERAFVEGVLF